MIHFIKRLYFIAIACIATLAATSCATDLTTDMMSSQLTSGTFDFTLDATLQDLNPSKLAKNRCFLSPAVSLEYPLYMYILNSYIDMYTQH